MTISSKLDFQLAYKRTRFYHGERSFVKNPFIFTWIESNLESWITNLVAKIDSEYLPHEAHICLAPKPKWLLRKGSVVDLRDEVLLNAVIGAIYPQIWGFVGWSQGSIDMGHQLNPNHLDIEWIKNRLIGWRTWTDKSRDLLNQGYTHVVIGDITSFYDNIDLKLLASDIKSICADTALVDILIKCLSRWALPNGRGLPQGFSASDILAKCYLNSIDKRIADFGQPYLRYVDDIRIFCRSHQEAKRTLIALSDLLVHRGLALHSGKTEIVSIAQAKEKFAGPIPLIDSLIKKVAETMHLDPYGTTLDMDREFSARPDSVPPEIFEEAFKVYIIEKAIFDKTLFRFLLTRLGRVKSYYAILYCLRVLNEHPEETAPVLKYFSAANLRKEDEERLLEFLASEDSVYEYQQYEILKWLYEESRFPRKLIEISRAWYFNRNKPEWLRTYCAAILGDNGTSADLERIAEEYRRATSQIEKAVIATCIKNMEKSRRNSIYGNIQSDGDLIKRAVNVAKAG